MILKGILCLSTELINDNQLFKKHMILNHIKIRDLGLPLLVKGKNDNWSGITIEIIWERHLVKNKEYLFLP